MVKDGIPYFIFMNKYNGAPVEKLLISGFVYSFVCCNTIKGIATGKVFTWKCMNKNCEQIIRTNQKYILLDEVVQLHSCKGDAKKKLDSLLVKPGQIVDKQTDIYNWYKSKQIIKDEKGNYYKKLKN